MDNVNIPLGIDDQIRQMKKYVTFRKCIRMERMLNYAGYFRLSRYGKYLLSHTNTLKTKPTQDLLFDAYAFDVELRRILFTYCKKAEIYFKSCLSNAISIELENPFFYLDQSSYTETKSENDKKKRDSNKEFFPMFYRNITAEERKLIQSQNKYPELKDYRSGGVRQKQKLPCWVAFSYFEFGTISIMYSYLRGDLRKRVISYGFTTSNPKKELTKQVDTWLDAIRNLRNICAHHNKLIGKTSSIVLLANNDSSDILKSDTDLFSRLYALKKILRPEDSLELKRDISKLTQKMKFDVYQFNILPSDWIEKFDRITFL